jgi:hypothetical protein
MKQKTICINAAIAVFMLASILSSTASAFDGHRKGFVMGFGLGVSQLAYGNVSGLGESKKVFGRGSNLLIGYAWNNANMLVLSGDYRNDWFADDVFLIEGTAIEGISWYHYWGGKHARWFSRVCVGELFVASDYRNVGGVGLGILAGGGYELFKQVQLGANFFGGKVSEAGKRSATAYSMTVVATIIAY